VNYIQQPETPRPLGRKILKAPSLFFLSRWNLTLDVSCRPENFEGQFPDSLRYDSFATNETRLLQRTSENQARVYQSSECQSSLRRGGRTDLYLLAFDIGGPCAMQFLSMDFYAKVSRRYLEALELNIHAIISPRNSNWPSQHWQIICRCSEIYFLFLLWKKSTFYYYYFIPHETLIITISILLYYNETLRELEIMHNLNFSAMK